MANSGAVGSSEAGRGMERYGFHGKARQGSAMSGRVCSGLVRVSRFGLAGRDFVWQVLEFRARRVGVRQGSVGSSVGIAVLARYGSAWSGTAYFGKARSSRSGMARFGTIRRGELW